MSDVDTTSKRRNTSSHGVIFIFCDKFGKCKLMVLMIRLRIVYVYGLWQKN